MGVRRRPARLEKVRDPMRSNICGYHHRPTYFDILFLLYCARHRVIRAVHGTTLGLRATLISASVLQWELWFPRSEAAALHGRQGHRARVCLECTAA